jgi:DNA-binding response OmpR family regulator
MPAPITVIRKFEAITTELPNRETARLTIQEAEVFWMLHAAGGKTVRHQAIWEQLYSLRPECDQPETSNDMVKIYVCKLRKKLKRHRIYTVWGVGYYMEVVA